MADPAWDDGGSTWDSGLRWDPLLLPAALGFTDIRTRWDNDNGYGDWRLAGAALETGHDLETALLISLFSDAEARADDILPDGSTDRRGWALDSGEAVRLGSRLWLLDRSKLTRGPINDITKKAEDYAAEALQWMIDDGVVAAFDIQARVRATSQLWLQIKGFRSQEGRVAPNYAWAWRGLVLETAA